jgi:SUMO ligase MMS21 Smc5/6 complex component
MRIITHTCPNCGTVVAGNVLETHREMKCPSLGCENVLQFSDLADADQEHILDNRERYRLE